MAEQQQQQQHIAIIGTGQAGVQAAASLRQAGFAGRLSLIGDEPHLPYQRPPLSKAYLTGDVAEARLALRPERFFTDQRIDTLFGVRVTAMDRARRLQLDDGGTLAPDRVLIATGTRARPLPGSPEGVHFLRNRDDVARLRPALQDGRHLTVVGGGYIGLEVAASARKRGVAVTVIEAGGRVMARSVADATSQFYHDQHRTHGVRLLLDGKIEGMERVGTRFLVRLSDEVIETDLLLIGIGAVANVEPFAGAGVVADGVIPVDQFAATTLDGVTAAGDCTVFPSALYGRTIRLESVQNATDQAKVAALTLLDRRGAYDPVPWFWSDQFDLRLQIAGLSEGAVRSVTRGRPADKAFSVWHLAADGRVLASEAVNAAKDHMAARKLIRAQRVIDPAVLADPDSDLRALSQETPLAAAS